MRVIWHESDIVVGVRFGKPGTTERWVIGYDPSRNSDTKFVTISMRDWMVSSARSAEVLAQGLTANEYLPEELLKE